MPLSVGAKLGPYVILSSIGRGGMGEVHKARVPRLDRTVALKVSKAEFGERFTREARLVAQLNHPHISTLHDVGLNYLVMEFVEFLEVFKAREPRGSAAIWDRLQVDKGPCDSRSGNEKRARCLYRGRLSPALLG